LSVSFMTNFVFLTTHQAFSLQCVKMIPTHPQWLLYWMPSKKKKYRASLYEYM
jgi:hypothetical protein